MKYNRSHCRLSLLIIGFLFWPPIFTETLRAEADSTMSIVGRVIDGETGLPLLSANVHLLLLRIIYGTILDCFLSELRLCFRETEYSCGSHKS